MIKRRLPAALVLVLLGSFVNFAIAWACAWWIPPQYVRTECVPPSTFWVGSTQVQDRSSDRVQPIALSRGFGITTDVLFPVDWDAYSMYLTEHNLAKALDSLLDGQRMRDPRLNAVAAREVWASNWVGPDKATMRASAGWPARSSRGWGPATAWLKPRLRNPIATTRHGDCAIVKVRRLEGQDIVHLLPWQPIWPGFAINTLFYAVILWMLSAAPFALRRRIRIRRGLCPACAYPVGDSPVCTECGKPLIKQKAQKQKAEMT